MKNTYYHYKTGATNKPSRSRFHRPSLSLKKTFLTFLVAAVIFLGSSYFWYKTSLRPVGSGDPKTFTVSEGDSVGNIMDRLKDEDLVKSSLALKIHARINGTYSKLKVGTYYISPELSGPQIIEVISGGKVSTKLTILAGKTIEELSPQLYQEFGQDQVQQTIDSLTTDFNPLLTSQPGPKANLEGYLMPETYTDISPNTTFSDWLTRNFDLFSKKVDPLKSKLAERGFSVNQAFILASIIQQESSKPEEQKKIAQVFELRLKQDIPLGADPTFIYAAKLKGVTPSPTIDSPYNTRINKGLPPSPIGTFEMSALEAVANPAEGDFLFFVAGDDGTIHYSRTEEEHKASIQQYCHQNCNLF